MVPPSSPRRARLVGLVLVWLAVVAVGVTGGFALAGGRTGLLIGLGITVVLVAVVLSALGTATVVERSVARTHRELASTARLVDRLEQREARHAEAAKQETRTTQQMVRNLDDQLQSAANLRTLLTIREPLPVLGRFTASADLLVVLVEELLERRPRTVVEAGSGVSTLVLALAVEQYDLPTQVVALEHLPEYAEETRALLRRHGVEHRAEVRDAPLTDVGLPGHPTPWYDPSRIADLGEVGLVLVDGPPESTGEAVRYPMVPLLRDHLATACTVLVDDTARPGDAAVVERWLTELPGFRRDDLPLEKGAVALRR